MAAHNQTLQENRNPNLLIHEKSPYLLQHAYNPVDWRPWGDEAFETARREEKPVFLSIGYSTCHWCHVMERESFEDAEAAAILNQTFVPIKVDREERPDIDNIYMNVCQAMTGGGGWPLTILMTPDKKPFFAGTYFPKNGRYGRIGIMELARQIGEIWKDRRVEVLATADEIVQAVREAADSFEKTDLGRDDIETAFKHLESRHDSQYGGFSTQPKFPTPHNLLFLMRYYTRTASKNALKMAEHTLREMRKGGIYDHIGFGFHRYSTDRRWLVPHFEKMLYDQAMLVMAYAELYQLTGKEEHKKTAKEILEYVSRDMTHPEGGFYSAEDADSEGVEGKFYVWTMDELTELLGPEDAKLASEIFSCKPAGNFLEESTQESTGENILHLERTIHEWSEQLPLTEDELNKTLSRIRGTLFAAREERIHPYKDDKIMTDWNGLMIAAYAVAARTFDEPELAEPAKRAVRFILNTLSAEDGRLLHRYRDGEAGIPAFLDDYAFFVWGLLELYETTFRAEYLHQALRLKNMMLESFGDAKDGALFFYPADGEELITRQKEVYDGAIPSGNSVAMMNFLRLGRITGDPALEERAQEIQRYFGGIVRKTPSAFTQLLCAVDFADGESLEIVIAGDIEDPRTKELIRTVRSIYLPHKVVVHKPAREAAQEIEAVAGYLADYREVDGKPAAYICRNHACERPVTDMEELRKMLETTDASRQAGIGYR